MPRKTKCKCGRVIIVSVRAADTAVACPKCGEQVLFPPTSKTEATSAAPRSQKQKPPTGEPVAPPVIRSPVQLRQSPPAPPSTPPSSSGAVAPSSQVAGTQNRVAAENSPSENGNASKRDRKKQRAEKRRKRKKKTMASQSPAATPQSGLEAPRKPVDAASGAPETDPPSQRDDSLEKSSGAEVAPPPIQHPPVQSELSRKSVAHAEFDSSPPPPSKAALADAALADWAAHEAASKNAAELAERTSGPTGQTESDKTANASQRKQDAQVRQNQNAKPGHSETGEPLSTIEAKLAAKPKWKTDSTPLKPASRSAPTSAPPSDAVEGPTEEPQSKTSKSIPSKAAESKAAESKNIQSRINADARKTKRPKATGRRGAPAASGAGEQRGNPNQNADKPGSLDLNGDRGRADLDRQPPPARDRVDVEAKASPDKTLAGSNSGPISQIDSAESAMASLDQIVTEVAAPTPPPKAKPKHQAKPTESETLGLQDAPPVQTGDSVIYGVEHDPDRIAACYTFGGAMILTAIFGAAPALYQLGAYFLSSEPSRLESWALLLVAVGGIQFAYACYLMQAPDWATAQVASFFMAGLATVFAAALGAITFSSPLGGVVRFLQIFAYHADSRACGWCFIMLMLTGCIAFFGGRFAGRWKQEETEIEL